VARYTSYRRFTVQTQEDIHVNANPDARPPRPQATESRRKAIE
jgi:hypothetical protein